MKRRIKILIADDEELNHIFYREILPENTFELSFVENGLEVIEKVNKKSEYFDLILMDMKMPEIDGFVATKEIRKLNKQIPIIAQTAYAYKEDINKALNAGCNDYISKPIHEEVLLEKINSLTKEKLFS